jgi:spermidine synthase
MDQTSYIKKLFSYFSGVLLRKYISNYSGNLYIMLENGKKVLNTDQVNYSYNSLHRVFKTAFARSGLKADPIDHTLILGLGGGSILQILREDYNLKTPITIVEIDPVIIEIARREFNIDQYSPIHIIEADAMEYVENNTIQHNLVCIDLFINENVPSEFLNIAFMQKLLSATTISGSIYFNIIVAGKQVKEKLAEIRKFLEQKKGTEISDSYSLELEENNLVLVVKK